LIGCSDFLPFFRFKAHFQLGFYLFFCIFLRLTGVGSAQPSEVAKNGKNKMNKIKQQQQQLLN